jgi:hypothetical protein
LGLLATSAILSWARERFAVLWPIELSQTYVQNALGVALLLVVIFLIFRWIFAVRGEMRMLEEHLGDLIETQPYQLYAWTVVIAVVLGTLGYLSSSPALFNGVFVGYTLVNMWGMKLLEDQLRSVLHKASIEEIPLQPKGSPREIIAHFYLHRPQFQRVATIMFLGFVALAMAEAAALRPDLRYAPVLTCSAYGLTIANVLGSEFVIYRWRKARDRTLGENYSF